MKNINSFRFVEEALEGEIRRQIRALERGETLRPQTRGYNADKGESYVLRDKEAEQEYRYFPDPDLPPLKVDEALLAEVAARMPELPHEKRARWQTELGLSAYAAGVLTSHPRIAGFFEEAVLLGADAVKAANFVQSEVLRDVSQRGLDADIPVTARQIAELLRLVDEGAISGKQAKEIYAAMRGTPRSAGELVEALGMKVIRDQATLRDLARQIIAAHPKQVETYRGGKTGLLGFFVGQLMKETRGAADPNLANELMKSELKGDS
jgi:aspartyl-tRNA(Asn)/glutamyl-tRNA(Gln) amidotransferase subunit B